MKATLPGPNCTGAAVSPTQLRKRGTQFVDESEEGPASREYRAEVNAGGCPSEILSATYTWMAGTKLMRDPLEEET